jgi:hypothetical protein
MKLALVSPALLTSSAERRGPSLVGSCDDSVGSTIRRPWAGERFPPVPSSSTPSPVSELGAGDGIQQEPLRVDSTHTIVAKTVSLETRPTGWSQRYGPMAHCGALPTVNSLIFGLSVGLKHRLRLGRHAQVARRSIFVTSNLVAEGGFRWTNNRRPRGAGGWARMARCSGGGAFYGVEARRLAKALAGWPCTSDRLSPFR